MRCCAWNVKFRYLQFGNNISQNAEDTLIHYMYLNLYQ